MKVKCSLSIPIALLIIVVLVVIFGIISGNVVGAADSNSATYQPHEASTVISKYETTDLTHIPVYTCTYDGCMETYTGVETAHNIDNYIDNGNGTHTGTCSDCGYIVTENHTNGTNASCSKCNYVIISVANDVLGSTNENNTNINIEISDDNSGSNNTNLSTDETKTNESIPQTGVNSVVIIGCIVAFMTLATMAGIQINKYKGI